MRFLPLWSLVCLAGLALATGCGGLTNGQVVKQHSPTIAPLRARLAAIAKAIDSEPAVAGDSAVPGLSRRHCGDRRVFG
jgi:hypothetical protein